MHLSTGRNEMTRTDRRGVGIGPGEKSGVEARRRTKDVLISTGERTLGEEGTGVTTV